MVSETEYRIERHAHGALIMGAIANHLERRRVLEFLKRTMGLFVQDRVIATVTGASIAVTTLQGSRCWRDDLAEEISARYPDPPPPPWSPGSYDSIPPHSTAAFLDCLAWELGHIVRENKPKFVSFDPIKNLFRLADVLTGRRRAAR